jgi:hypothetical protein
VLPDIVKPALTVLVNGAVKENHATVNTNPELSIYLVDENPLLPSDLMAVEVYLANCDTCSLQRIPQESLVITAMSANQLRVTTTLALQAGETYKLIVFGKDAVGNRTQPPYTLTLRVVGTDEPVTFITYPNPATTYVRFELNLSMQVLPIESKLTIYNIWGLPVYDDKFPISIGKNALLWQAQTPGLYPYILRLVWNDGRTETRTGKVIWHN